MFRRLSSLLALVALLTLVFGFSLASCSLEVTTPVLGPGVAPVQLTEFSIGYGTRLTDSTAVILAEVIPASRDTTLEVRWFASAADRASQSNALSTAFNYGRVVSLVPGAAYELWASVRVDSLSPWTSRYFRYERGWGPTWAPKGTVWSY
jgi:hypothetical protein